MATKLNEKAILIKVELKKWGGTKVDKGLSKEIADKHDVDSKHFSVSKKLTNSKNLKEIKKIDGLIRTDCIYSGAGYRDTVMLGIIKVHIFCLLMRKQSLRKGLLNTGIQGNCMLGFSQGVS